MGLVDDGLNGIAERRHFGAVHGDAEARQSGDAAVLELGEGNRDGMERERMGREVKGQGEQRE